MSAFKTISPAGSYSITVPEGTRERYDGRVVSLWAEGDLLMQISSYLRTEGPQVAAQERLDARKPKDPQRWIPRAAKLHDDATVDQATAEMLDGTVLWLHTYLVWPHLTVYVSISGPEREVRDHRNWALRSLNTIRLVIH